MHLIFIKKRSLIVEYQILNLRIMVRFHSLLIIEYINLIIYLICCFAISCLLICLSFLFIMFKNENNKIKPYECGFQNFGIVYNQYEIHYYKTAILFLIFDIEIIFLIPANTNFFLLSSAGLFMFYFFIYFLIYTLIYEYYNEILTWNIF